MIRGDLAPYLFVKMIQYLEIGKIVTTHGVNGEVKVYISADSPESLYHVERVYLNASAGLAREFGKGGGKVNRAEIQPGKIPLFYPSAQLRRVDPGRADVFKGQGGTPTLGQIGALKDAGTDVAQRGMEGGAVGGGGNPRHVQIIQVILPMPALEGYHRQIQSVQI